MPGRRGTPSRRAPAKPRAAPAAPRTKSAAGALTINRAPVLTLWAAVVAERLGYDADEALSLGKAVAGLNAYLKARSLGLYEALPPKPPERRRAAAEEPGRIELLGRRVPVTRTEAGWRAVEKNKPITPESVEKYLETKFGAGLPPARAAMESLARALPKAELATRAFSLYESFRPEIPSGTRGWGAKGVLDLARILRLAAAHRDAK